MTGKRIVLCSDGTGNAPGKGKGTNVWQLFLAVDQHGHERAPGTDCGTSGAGEQADEADEAEQLAFYDDGVGTSTFKPKEVLGLAFGVGLGANIRELYTALSRNYAPGDSIYLFGFSRGAFTARSLAGMISSAGVIEGRGRSKTGLDKDVMTAYKAYRSRFGPELDKLKDHLRDDEGMVVHDARIRFLGVWDTVSAVGVPVDELRLLLQKVAMFRRPHLVDLTSNIDCACHALAIDETRKSFKLLMFDEEKAPHANVEQVWFPGVHSNVGGGYPKKGMENVGLHWMMTRAQERGLRFIKGAVDESYAHANVHSKLYDSRKGLATYYRYQPRNVEMCCAEGHQTRPKVHVSALQRIERATKDYGPINLPVDLEIVGTWTDSAEGRLSARKGLSATEASRQRHEQTQIERYLALLERSRDDRGGLTGPSKRYTGMRIGLYYLFLLVSLFLVAVLGTNELASKMEVVDGKGTLAPQHSSAAALMGQLEELSARLDGLFSWAGPAVSWLPDGLPALAKSLVNLALPDFIAGPVLGLARLPSLTGIILVAGLLLLLARYLLVTKMSDIGADTWRGIRPGGRGDDDKTEAAIAEEAEEAEEPTEVQPTEVPPEYEQDL